MSKNKKAVIIIGAVFLLLVFVWSLITFIGVVKTISSVPSPKSYPTVSSPEPSPAVSVNTFDNIDDSYKKDFIKGSPWVYSEKFAEPYCGGSVVAVTENGQAWGYVLDDKCNKGKTVYLGDGYKPTDFNPGKFASMTRTSNGVTYVIVPEHISFP